MTFATLELLYTTKLKPLSSLSLFQACCISRRSSPPRNEHRMLLGNAPLIGSGTLKSLPCAWNRIVILPDRQTLFKMSNNSLEAECLNFAAFLGWVICPQIAANIIDVGKVFSTKNAKSPWLFGPISVLVAVAVSKVGTSEWGHNRVWLFLHESRLFDFHFPEMTVGKTNFKTNDYSKLDKRLNQSNQ